MGAAATDFHTPEGCGGAREATSPDLRRGWARATIMSAQHIPTNQGDSR
jgi:hypothetical protein